MDLDVGETTSSLQVKPRRRLLYIVVIAALVAIVVSIISGVIWYRLSLQPISTQSKARVYTLESGQTIKQVGSSLADNQLVHSRLAFQIYMRLHGGTVQAGVYHLNQNMSLDAIAEALISGKQASYSVTFYPGSTLRSASSVPEKQRMDVVTVLKRAGFDDQDISSALDASYDSPLMKSRPQRASLEGYIYGDTYQIDSAANAKVIIGTAIDTFWQKITENDLVARLKARGFSLYQGITLASIVQAEASNATDQRHVAQVFELRLKQGLPLGSDVTFIYAANQLGVEATPQLKSPYNTRIHTGLPPGPINTPSLDALKAVASPAKGDYLYFVAGDNGQIHYSKTLDQHQANIEKYCTKLCN